MGHRAAPGPGPRRCRGRSALVRQESGHVAVEQPVGASSAQAPGNEIPDWMLSGWSWGPFLLPLPWVCWNGNAPLKFVAAMVFIADFVPGAKVVGIVAGLVLGIYLGIKGNRIMAANREFRNVDAFVAVRTAWAYWGLGVSCVELILLLVALGAVPTQRPPHF